MKTDQLILGGIEFQTTIRGSRYSTSSLVEMDKEQAVQYHQHSTNNQQTNYPSDNQHHTQPVQTTRHPKTMQKEKERDCFLDELHCKPQMRQKNTTPNEQDTPVSHTKTTKTYKYNQWKATILKFMKENRGIQKKAKHRGTTMNIARYNVLDHSSIYKEFLNSQI